jgi:hypothetical protein
MSRKLKPQINERAPKRIRQSRAVRRRGVVAAGVSVRGVVTALMDVTMRQTIS